MGIPLHWSTAPYSDPNPTMTASIVMKDELVVVAHITGDDDAWHWVVYFPEEPGGHAKREEQAKAAVQERVNAWAKALATYDTDDE